MIEFLRKMFRRIELPLYGRKWKDKLKLLKWVPIYAAFYIGRTFSNKLRRNLVRIKIDATIRDKEGLLFYLKDVDAIIHYVSSYEDEKPVRESITEDERKAVCVEVGAHIGTHTLRWAKKFRRVVALEPHPDNREALNKNISINKINNIVVIDKAAYSRRGELKLYLSEEGSGSHSLLKKVGDKYVTVKTDTLDNILSSEGIKLADVSFLKIDVEGAELDVLRGAERVLKEGKPIIVFEAWDEDKAAQIIAFLKDRGYGVFEHISTINYLARP